MSEVDNFFASLKEKRGEAVDYFTSEEFLQLQASESPEAAAVKGVDQLIAGILDVVEERHSDIITADLVEGDDEPTVLVTCTTDLANLYFEQVNS